MAKKATKKKNGKKKATVSVRRNGKTLYGAVAKNILKKRAAAKRRSTAKANPKAKKKTAKKRTATSRKRTLSTATAKANPKRKTTKKNVSKKRVSTKRNAESYSPAQPIKVTQYYRSGGPGYATARERIIRQGQRDMFAPDASINELLGFLKKNPTVIDAVKKKLGAAKFATASPTLLKKTMREVITGARGKAKKAKKRNAAPKRKRSNPNGELFEMFTGQPHTGHEVVTAPSGAPANLDQCGQFVEFKWIDQDSKRHTVNLEQQGIPAILAAHRFANGHDELFLVSAPGLPLPNFGDYLPRGDNGYITEVTYRAQKVHLGDAKPQLYYHKLGEETGQPPILHINKEGELIFKGGEYWIEASGIHN